MHTIKARDILLISIALTLPFGWLIIPSGFATDSLDAERIIYLEEEDQPSTSPVNFSTTTLTPTPHGTSAIILPIIQQDASLQTSESQASEDQSPPPTITPTPVPPQSPQVNTPIVFGAVVIVLIILSAWLFIGRQKFTRGN